LSGVLYCYAGTAEAHRCRCGKISVKVPPPLAGRTFVHRARLGCLTKELGLAWQVAGLSSRPRARPRPVGGRSHLSAGEPRAGIVRGLHIHAGDLYPSWQNTQPGRTCQHCMADNIIRQVPSLPSRLQPVILVSALLITMQHQVLLSLP
jgi:hypothetical protein